MPSSGGRCFTEETTVIRCREVIADCRAFPGSVIFVTNEVGMGIIPENEAARRFRDCAGRCNQLIAAAAAEVTLVVSGIPLRLKGGRRLRRPETEGLHGTRDRRDHQHYYSGT